MFQTPRQQNELDDNFPFYRHIDVERAKKTDVEETRRDPIGALNWDRAADRRLAAWQASPFFAGFELLVARKYEVVS